MAQAAVAYREIAANPVSGVRTRTKVADKLRVHEKRIPFIRSTFDPSYGITWATMTSEGPAKFTVDLVGELRQFQTKLAQETQRDIANEIEERTRYLVFTSEIPGVFNLGGDLEFFEAAIRSGQREQLTRYAHECVDLVYYNAVSYDLPMTTISLVNGTALGGGMEAALSSNVVIAERGATMGLPEILFNMFPGMGAYQFLSRRVSPAQAEKIILGGRTYSAEELYELGLVDVLADEGKGEQAVYSYVKKHRRQTSAHFGLRRAIDKVHPIRRDELLDVVNVWVDTAMNLSESDLVRMRYLIESQKRRGF